MKRYKVAPAHTPTGQKPRYGFYNEKTGGEAGTFSTADEALDIILSMKKGAIITEEHATELVITEVIPTKVPILGARDDKDFKKNFIIMEKFYKLKLKSIGYPTHWVITK